jgi:hypothetical protein
MNFGVAIFPPENAGAVEEGFDRYVSAINQFRRAG